jgi:hypothetical protein
MNLLDAKCDVGCSLIRFPHPLCARRWKSVPLGLITLRKFQHKSGNQQLPKGVLVLSSS